MNLYMIMKIYENRNLMVADIIPKNGVYCEIGVFKGDFSKYLIETLEPKLFHMIDIFEGNTTSGDQDGNNVTTTNMTDEYVKLQKLYFDYPNVKLWKGDSAPTLSLFQDNSLDMIYIDGDHSYEGCSKDLEVAYKKVKNGGYILGHDYETNMSKCTTNWKFGVRQAAEEFCQKYGQEICALGKDGCVSFAIHLRK